MENVLHVGIDVDDRAFHGAGFCQQTGEVLEFACKPTQEALIKKLSKLQEQGFQLQTYYEATYLGFSLQRFLVQKNIACTVIAPSLIPEVSGHRVKNDRLDCLKLARYAAKGLLTPVYVPDEDEEQTRDLLRSRSFLVDQSKALKTHILFICRRLGLDYKEGQKKKYWTQTHEAWLSTQVRSLTGMAQANLSLLLGQLERLGELIANYDQCIVQLAEAPRYQKSVSALNCLRGIDTLSAMTLITELGDIKRFSHPKQLTSYAGLDVREYSSGGKERRYGITKMGNRRVRTTVIESCQFASRPVALSRRLKLARAGRPSEVITIADRCMRRLHQRSWHLRERGKHNNKVKTACARELLGFTWEILRAVN